MNSKLNYKFRPNSFQIRRSFHESEEDYGRTQFCNDEPDYNFEKCLEEGEISSDSEKKDHKWGQSFNSKCASEESIQWSELQILMIGDERVNEYNWMYQKMYPNQHFFHYKGANLHTLCEFIDNQINKTFDIVLIFAFHYDFIQQQHDSPLLGLNPKVNLENLAKTVGKFHSKWKKLYNGTKIIWVLPSAMNFYEFNSNKIKYHKTFSHLVNEIEQHSLSKEYFDYTHKLSQCLRRNLKSVPFFPLNDVLFMKRHPYRKSFYEEKIPRFPKGLLLEGLKPTKLMTGYLAYKLTEFMQEEGFFPLIKYIPNLRNTVDNVLSADATLKNNFHDHSKKRESSSHRHKHSKRRRHYSDSFSSESSFSSDSELRKRKISKTRHHKSRKQEKISAHESRSSSQVLPKIRPTDKIVSHGLKLDTPPHSSSTSSPSEEVEFYRKLANLREIHDYQCNLFKCKPTTHPLYVKENIKYINQMRSSNFSMGDISDKWHAFWIIRLEELCNENWELRKEQLIIDLKKKKSLKTTEPEETIPEWPQFVPNVEDGSKEPNTSTGTDVGEHDKLKKFHSDISSSPSSEIIDLTVSPIKKEKLKIKIEDYKKMQRPKPFSSELQDEIKYFSTSSESVGQESMDQKLEHSNECPSPPIKSEVLTKNSALPKLNSNLDSSLPSPKCLSSPSSAPVFKEKIEKFLASKNIDQESMDKTIEYFKMCPSSPGSRSELFSKDSAAPKLNSDLDSPLLSPKCLSSPSSAPDFKEEIKKFLATSKNIDQELFSKNSSAPKLMSNIHSSPKCLTSSYSAPDFKEEIKVIIASSKNMNKKCPFSPNNQTHLTKTSASPIFISNSVTPSQSPKSNCSESFDSELISIDSDCDIDVDMLMDDDDFLLDLKEIDEELKKAAPLPIDFSPESPPNERSVSQAVITPKVYSSLGKHFPTASIPLKDTAPNSMLLPKAIVPPNFGPTKLLPQAAVMPNVSCALKEKILPKATVSPLGFDLKPVSTIVNVLEAPVNDQTLPSHSEVCADYVVILKMLFRLARHLGSLSLSITTMHNAAMKELRVDEDALCFPDDDAKTILTLVNQKLNSLLKGDITPVQRAIFGEVSGRLKKLLDSLNMQYDKFSNVNIQNIAAATIGKSVQDIVAFIKNTLLYHGYHNFQSKDVMNLYMSVKSAHSNMLSMD